MTKHAAGSCFRMTSVGFSLCVCVCVADTLIRVFRNCSCSPLSQILFCPPTPTTATAKRVASELPNTTRSEWMVPLSPERSLVCPVISILSSRTPPFLLPILRVQSNYRPSFATGLWDHRNTPYTHTDHLYIIHNGVGGKPAKILLEFCVHIVPFYSQFSPRKFHFACMSIHVSPSSSKPSRFIPLSLRAIDSLSSVTLPATLQRLQCGKHSVSLSTSPSLSPAHTRAHIRGQCCSFHMVFSGTCCDAHFPFSSGGAPSLRGLGMWDKCIKPPQSQLLICFETSKVPTKRQHIPPIDQQRLASSRGMVEFT